MQGISRFTILMALVAFPYRMYAEDPAPFGKDGHVAIFKVTGAELKSTRGSKEENQAIFGIQIKEYQISLTMEKCLPVHDTSKVYSIKVEHAEGPEADSLGLQDWIPITIDSRFLGGFQGWEVTSGEKLGALGAGKDIDESWLEVKTFWDTFSRKDVPVSEAVAETLHNEKSRLHATFFQLLFGYHRSVLKHPKVMKALAEFIIQDDVSGEIKEMIIYELDSEDLREVPVDIRAALATAILHIILEAQADKRMEPGNLIKDFCGLFLKTKDSVISAKELVGAETLRLLQKMMEDRTLHFDKDSKPKFAEWINR